MKNLSKYRLNSMSEIDAFAAKVGEVQFYAYYDVVRKIIENLQPGNIYDIVANVRHENLEVFIKCVCLYIRRTGGSCNVELSNDYHKVKGIIPYNVEHVEQKQKVKSDEEVQ